MLRQEKVSKARRARKRGKELPERIRQEVDTDPVKAGFGLTDLKRSAYISGTKLASNMGYLDIRRLAMELVEKANRFRLNSASKARSLLLDVGKISKN